MTRLIAAFMLLLTLAASVYADDRGPAISIELRDIELKDVLRAIGQEHRINMVVDDSITGKVTVSLRNVPLWDAVDSILRGKGYTYIKDGNIVRIVKAAEEEELVTRSMKIRYGNPKDLEPVIKKMLTKKGDVISDMRTSTLIVKDIPSSVAMAEKILREVDVRTGQVMIEAKIVEANTNARKELGIQWGHDYRSGEFVSYGGATKDKSDDKYSVPVTGGIGAFGTALNVNLPADVKEGSGGAIGFAILSKNLTLELQLSALEDSGSAKILSSPKVMVSDNQEATIASGTQIIIVNEANTVINTGQSTGQSPSTSQTTIEKEAALRLTVTPRIIDPEQISLKIATKKEEFDFTRAVLGVPPKISRETQTNLIVKNGETIVIGGIYEEKDYESDSAVPALSKIPLLGWLFKKEAMKKDKTELLIFITPTIRAEK
jgi:type IV pilus assembly protein PilQ